MYASLVTILLTGTNNQFESPEVFSQERMNLYNRDIIESDDKPTDRSKRNRNHQLIRSSETDLQRDIVTPTEFKSILKPSAESSKFNSVSFKNTIEQPENRTKFTVNQVGSPYDEAEEESKYRTEDQTLKTYSNLDSRYHTEDKSAYFTSQYYLLNEMVKQVKRDYDETVVHPKDYEYHKDYVNNVCASYNSTKNASNVHYMPDSRSISNQEFIDRAYYDVVVRSYSRHRKRYRTSYPTYGENLHDTRSTNRVIINYPSTKDSTLSSKYRTTAKMLEVVD